MNAGEDVRTAFLAQEHPKYIAIKSVDDTEFSKDKPIEILETNEELPASKKRKRGNQNKQWEADHVQDLGSHTTIVAGTKPANIPQAAWDILKDSVLGVHLDPVSDSYVLRALSVYYITRVTETMCSS